jgi:hypothetical protein
MRNFYYGRQFILAAAILLMSACSMPGKAQDDGCGAPKMTEQQLIQIIAAEFRRRGSSFQPTSENSRVEFAERGCDHLVRITFLPERPGGFEIYRIDRSGKIVEYVPGH